MTRVALAGVVKVPEIATFPDAVIVFVPVLVIVPVLVKAPQLTVEAPPENVIVPPFVTAFAPAATDPLAPTVSVPLKVDEFPSVKVLAPTATLEPAAAIMPPVNVAPAVKVRSVRFGRFAVGAYIKLPIVRSCPDQLISVPV
jgi:hypothetical protein